MDILILGAGAVGGYFGTRLLQAGRDVTFLVRPTRRQVLDQQGLVVRSPRGDARIDAPPTILAATTPAALILLCCKAYDLAAAIEAIRPAVGADTAILPLLNGMKHLDALAQAFGAEKVLGGECVIAAQLNEQGEILHLTPDQRLSFGERDGRATPRAQAVADRLGAANVEGRLSSTIEQDMWEKWVMLASLAGITCLMRSGIGDILASPHGERSIRELFEECRSIAEQAGHAPRPEFVAMTLERLTKQGSPLTASMLRDIQGNRAVEADHILGDLLSRRQSNAGSPVSLLEIAYAHVKAYEHGRRRAAAR